MKLTQEELKVLETIFTLARQQVVSNEQQLIAVINFKQSLFKKLTEEEKPQEPKSTKAK